MLRLWRFLGESDYYSMTQDNFEVFLTHLKDQQNAAVEQAATHVEKVDEITSVIRGEENRKYLTQDFPATYVGQKFKWVGSYEEFAKATIRGCPHVSLKSPSVYYINIWAPEAIGCATCTYEKAEAFNKQFPNVCDFCYGKYEMFHESIFQIGPFVIFGNLCESCYGKQYAASLES